MLNDDPAFAVEKGKKSQAWQQLTFDEHAEIEAAAINLKTSIKDGNYKIIRTGIEQLDKKTRRFAEIMMDSAVTGALGGKTMQAAGESIDAKGAAPTAPHAFKKAEFEDSTPNIIESDEANPETPGESTED